MRQAEVASDDKRLFEGLLDACSVVLVCAMESEDSASRELDEDELVQLLWKLLEIERRWAPPVSVS